MNKVLSVEELKGQLVYLSSDVSNDVADPDYYSDDCCMYDAIIESADGYIDIYTNDILEWLKDNYEEYDEYVSECGVCSEGIIRTTQCAQGMYYERQAFDEINDIWKNFTINHIISRVESDDFLVTQEMVDNALSINFNEDEELGNIKSKIDECLELDVEEGEYLPSFEDGEEERVNNIKSHIEKDDNFDYLYTEFDFGENEYIYNAYFDDENKLHILYKIVR